MFGINLGVLGCWRGIGTSSNLEFWSQLSTLVADNGWSASYSGEEKKTKVLISREWVRPKWYLLLHLFQSINDPFFLLSKLLHCKYCHKSTHKVSLYNISKSRCYSCLTFCVVLLLMFEAKSSFVPPSSFRTVHAISMHGGVNPGYFIHHRGFTGALYFIKCKFILYTPRGFTRALYFTKCKFILYTPTGFTGSFYAL